MKIPFWLYAAGALLLAFLGFAASKERKINGLIRAARKAENEAASAKQETIRQRHESERKRLEKSLEVERKRPVADRIRESYAEYRRRKG